MPDDLTAREITGLLADPHRRAVFAAVVLGAPDLTTIGERTGLDPRTAAQALAKLTAAGLVTSNGDLSVPDAPFRNAAAQPAPAEPDHPDLALRGFVRGTVLIGMPAQRSKRLRVLEHVAQSFEPGQRYPERQVTDMLSAWCAGGGTDHAALRRYLVDEGLLSRADGEYWRTGGPVPL